MKGLVGLSNYELLKAITRQLSGAAGIWTWDIQIQKPTR